MGAQPASPGSRAHYYLGKEAVQNILYSRFANAFLEPILRYDRGRALAPAKA